MENVNVVAEARQLNVKVEKEPDGTFVAVLPGPNDEEEVLPGATQEEAILEARAFRAIEASELYHVQYDDKKNVYVVTFAEGAPVKGCFVDALLHKAYAQAQERYADEFKKVDLAPPEPKPNGATRKRRAKAAEPQQPAGEQITSGSQLKLEAAYDNLEKAMRGLRDALVKASEVFETMAKNMKERKHAPSEEA